MRCSVSWFALSIQDPQFLSWSDTYLNSASRFFRLIEVSIFDVRTISVFALPELPEPERRTVQGRWLDGAGVSSSASLTLCLKENVLYILEEFEGIWSASAVINYQAGVPWSKQVS